MWAVLRPLDQFCDPDGEFDALANLLGACALAAGRGVAAQLPQSGEQSVETLAQQ